jgi:hypothetical protein
VSIVAAALMWGLVVENFSVKLELDLKFSSKFRKFAEPNSKSSSEFNRNYFGSNLFEPQSF